jgi:hypothetical protein
MTMTSQWLNICLDQAIQQMIKEKNEMIIAIHSVNVTHVKDQNE